MLSRWNEPSVASEDAGYMKFPIKYDEMLQTIEGNGSDHAGAFEIFGVFDGCTMTFTKQYNSWKWDYSGNVIEQDETSYDVAGTWGLDGVKYGSFTACCASQEQAPLTLARRLVGGWTGHYFYNDNPMHVDPPMKIHLSIMAPNIIQGGGEDGVGYFELSGKVKGEVVTLLKTYLESPWSWVYEGKISEESSLISGTWGYPESTQGTFELSKVKLEGNEY